MPNESPASQRPLVPADHRLGLALSGGGSRAAAFHRGTVAALARLGLLDAVDVVSTVSGGSVFGGAWMAARSANKPDTTFLASMKEELQKGFLTPKLLKALLPGITRTDVMAEIFDERLMHGATLGALPSRPRLCVNATALNHGQVAKLCRDGFTVRNVETANGQRLVPITQFSLARAVAASAAFPVGLPPLVLSRTRDLEGAVFTGPLSGQEKVALTDGGVLENLGVQSLLESDRFWTWDIVVSDAGTKQHAWSPSLLTPLKSAAIALVTAGSLDQVMTVMNNKENRWARQFTVGALHESWLAESVRSASTGGPVTTGAATLAQSARNFAPRRLLFVRVNQTLESLLAGISPWWLEELRGRAPVPVPAPFPSPVPSTVAGWAAELAKVGVDISAAVATYAQLGGVAGAQAMNQIGTQFTGLSEKVVDQLALHAEWQVLATHAIYGR